MHHANIYRSFLPLDDHLNEVLARLFILRPQLVNLALELFHIVEDVTRIAPSLALFPTSHIFIET